MTTKEVIVQVCDEIKELLILKNEQYGDSAIYPLRIFSKASTEEQLNVRIDDKLSRVARGSNETEDVEKDLIGYLILKRVLRILNSESSKEPKHDSHPEESWRM